MALFALNPKAAEKEDADRRNVLFSCPLKASVYGQTQRTEDIEEVGDETEIGLSGGWQDKMVHGDSLIRLVKVACPDWLNLSQPASSSECKEDVLLCVGGRMLVL